MPNRKKAAEGSGILMVVTICASLASLGCVVLAVIAGYQFLPLLLK